MGHLIISVSIKRELQVHFSNPLHPKENYCSTNFIISMQKIENSKNDQRKCKLHEPYLPHYIKNATSERWGITRKIG